MKYLGIVSDPNDLTNKQYVDDKVGEVSASLTTLSGRVDTAEDNIQMAESDIGDLQTETNTLKTDMTTVKGAVKTLQDTYVPNTTKVNGQALSGDVTIEAVQYTNQTLTASQKTQARNNIGAGTSNFSGSYNDLVDTPTIPEGAFISVYGTTTFEELQEAVNAKKQVFCYYTPVPIITYVFRLSTLNTQYGAIFEACDTDLFFDIIFCSIDSEWNHTGGYLMSPPSSLGGIMMVTQGDYGKEWELVDPPFASEPTTLTSTLSAGSTTLTLSNTAITTSSTIDIYTDKWGVNPTNVAVEAGKITLTFDKQSAALGVKVEVK